MKTQEEIKKQGLEPYAMPETLCEKLDAEAKLYGVLISRSKNLVNAIEALKVIASSYGEVFRFYVVRYALKELKARYLRTMLNEVEEGGRK